MIGTTAAIIGASVISAGASYAASSANAKAGKNAAAQNAAALTDAAHTNADTIEKNRVANEALVREQQGQNAQLYGDASAANNVAIDTLQNQGEGLFNPFIGRGNDAGSAINKLLGIGGDANTQSRAFQDWTDSVGYKFQLQSGSDAINSNKATAGLLKSGGTLKAQTEFGQKTGSTFFQTYLGNLQTQQSTGLSAANSLSNVYGNVASLRTANNTNTANGLAGNNTSSVNALVSGNTSATNGLVANTANLTNGLVANNNNALASTTASNTAAANNVSNLAGNALSAYGYSQGATSYNPAKAKAAQ